MSDLTEIKRGEHFVIFNDREGNPVLRIDKVRFSFANLGEKREETNEAGEKTYSWQLTAMLPKATHLAAKNAMKECIQAICAKNKFQVPMDKWCMSDGDQKIIQKTGKKDEIAAGHWLISMREQKNRPKARNGRGEILVESAEIDRVFFSGCWGHVLVRPWFFDGNVKGKTKTYPKRVSAGMVSVIHWKDDKAFGGGTVDDSDAWDNLPETEGASNGIDDDDEM
jgi:hypothetical protein